MRFGQLLFPHPPAETACLCACLSLGIRVCQRSLEMIAPMNLPRVAAAAPRTCKASNVVRTYMQDVTVKRKTGAPMVGRGPYGQGRYVDVLLTQQLGLGQCCHGVWRDRLPRPLCREQAREAWYAGRRALPRRGREASPPCAR